MSHCVTFRGTGSDLLLWTKAQYFCTEQEREKCKLVLRGESGRRPTGEVWVQETAKKKKPPHLHSCMHCLLYNQHLELVYMKQMVQSNVRRLQLPGKQRDSCSFETRLKKNVLEEASSDELVKQGRKWEERGDTKESVWSKERAITVSLSLQTTSWV